MVLKKFVSYMIKNSIINLILMLGRISRLVDFQAEDCAYFWKFLLVIGMNWKIASILIVSDTIMIANYKIWLLFTKTSVYKGGNYNFIYLHFSKSWK